MNCYQNEIFSSPIQNSNLFPNQMGTRYGKDTNTINSQEHSLKLNSPRNRICLNKFELERDILRIRNPNPDVYSK